MPRVSRAGSFDRDSSAAVPTGARCARYVLDERGRVRERARGRVTRGDCDIETETP